MHESMKRLCCDSSESTEIYFFIDTVQGRTMLLAIYRGGGGQSGNH